MSFGGDSKFSCGPACLDLYFAFDARIESQRIGCALTAQSCLLSASHPLQSHVSLPKAETQDHPMECF